jgi:protein-tyrosine phosphatase
VIDIHMHILPGVDDGVETEDEAVELARMSLAEGVHTVVATPHCKEGFYVVERQEVLERVARLRARLDREGIALSVLPGAEVHLCPDLELRVRDGRAPTLADNGRTLLLELSLSQYPVDLENLVFQLKLAGIETVLAHPERIRYFQDDVRRYEAVVNLGVYGQLTTGSVLGRFGSEARELSDELLRKGLAHILASDAHNVRGRAPALRQALEVIVPRVGERFARAMTSDIPRALLAGEIPEVPPVDDAASRRGSIFSRLFRRERPA